MMEEETDGQQEIDAEFKIQIGTNAGKTLKNFGSEVHILVKLQARRLKFYENLISQEFSKIFKTLNECFLITNSLLHRYLNNFLCIRNFKVLKRSHPENDKGIVRCRTFIGKLQKDSF